MRTRNRIKNILLVFSFTSCYSLAVEEQEMLSENRKTLPCLYFEFNSTNYYSDTAFYSNYQSEKDAVSSLKQIERVLKKNVDLSINVIGKVDFEEKTKYGYLRARKVSDYLVSKGINEDRLHISNQDTLNPIVSKEDFKNMESVEEKEYAKKLNQVVILTFK